MMLTVKLKSPFKYYIFYNSKLNPSHALLFDQVVWSFSAVNLVAIVLANGFQPKQTDLRRYNYIPISKLHYNTFSNSKEVGIRYWGIA